MPEVVTKDILTDTLARFRERGDERWMRRAEAEDVIRQALDVGSLTVEDLEEILGEIEGE